MIAGMKHVHELTNTCHGDIKGDNFLVCRTTGTVKLIDLGPSGGTEIYRPPEYSTPGALPFP